MSRQGKYPVIWARSLVLGLSLTRFGGSIMPSGVHHCRQEDMPQSVNAEASEVVFGEIQPESAPETLDSSGKFVPSQRCD